MTAHSKPTIEEWAEHWNNRAGISDPIARNGYCVDGAPISAEFHRRAILEPCLERLELEPQHHVLDVGCGTGLFLRELERRVERAVGTDVSEAMIRQYDGAAETLVCAAHELPFADQQFDRILMCSVAHYFPSVRYLGDVLGKLVALLRTPGILLVGNTLIGAQPPDTPFRWFAPREIVELLESLGLPYSIAAQSRLKRTINRRYDLIVYKD